MDCLLGLFFSCYILDVKLVDLMVDVRSKPCSFFCALYVGDCKVMLIAVKPLNCGCELFLFIDGFENKFRNGKV